MLFLTKRPNMEKESKRSLIAQMLVFTRSLCSACPVYVIDVRRTAILPAVEKKGFLEKKILEVPVPKALLLTCLNKYEVACLGCGNFNHLFGKFSQ